MSLFEPEFEPEKPIGAAASYSLPLAGGDEWAVPEPLIAEMARLHPAVDVPSELAKMRSWLLTNPTNRKTAKGLPRFISTWLGKEQDRAPAPPRESPKLVTFTRGFTTSDVRCTARNGGYHIYRCSKLWDWHQFGCRTEMTCCPVCGADMERMDS
jgi:hypothetical protein